MTSWIYRVGNKNACIEDTRNLVLQHGMIWCRAGDTRKVQPGDRILLAFNDEGTHIVPLALLEARLPQGAETPIRKGPCLAEMPDAPLTGYLDATKGVGGRGYQEMDNRDHTGLCVRVIDDCSSLWSKRAPGRDPHKAPPASEFGWMHREAGSGPIVEFDPSLLTDPLLPVELRP